MLITILYVQYLLTNRGLQVFFEYFFGSSKSKFYSIIYYTICY